MSECRLRVVGRGDDSIVYLDDGRTGELFALCPVPHKMRNVCVEQAVDSSRYFVLKIEDPGSGRHAFVGMGFQDRGDAFDFNVALTDQERRTEMKHNPSAQYTLDDGTVRDPQDDFSGGHRYGDEDGPAASTSAPAPASRQDYSLKDGQKIHINMNKPFSKASEKSGGFLSAAKGAGGLGLLPVPGLGVHTAAAAPRMPPPPPPGPAAQQTQGGGFDEWHWFGGPGGAAAPAPAPACSGGWTAFE